MASDPDATRAVATFLSHTSGSGVSSTDRRRVVHRSHPGSSTDPSSVCGDRSVSRREPRRISAVAGALEGRRDLEQPPVGAVRRDDLDADRQPVGGACRPAPRSPGSR